MIFDPVRLAIAAIVVAVLAFGGCRIKSYGDGRYDAGKSVVQQDWDAAVARGKAEVERLRIAAGRITVKTETVYVDRIKTIREKGDVIEKRVNVYVPTGSCGLPGGFRLLYDDAATDTVSDAADLADAAPVAAQDVASGVVDNFGTCHENAQRLTSLQDWVLAQCKDNPPPEGCSP